MTFPSQQGHDPEDVKKFLTWLERHNGRPEGTKWKEIARNFNIRDTGLGQREGDRARKLWDAYKASGQTVDEYLISKFRISYERVDGISDSPVTEEYMRVSQQENVTYYDVALHNVHTEDDAYREFNIDRSKFVIQKFKMGRWHQGSKANGIQVLSSVKFEVRRYQDVYGYNPENLDLVEKQIHANLKKYVSKKVNGSGVGVVVIADLHLGAYVRGMTLTPDYDTDIAERRLAHVANITNGRKYDEVHVVILGDIIHSFSGHNHPNTHEQLHNGFTGHSAIVKSANILGHFLSLFNNLAHVYMVGGNHDRIPADKNLENRGEAARIIFDYVQFGMRDTKMTYGTMVAVEIDGLNYILSHGHVPNTKKPAPELIHEFSHRGHIDNKKYTTILLGHTHTRSSKQPMVRGGAETIEKDSANYCKRVVPPIFSGDDFSESHFMFSNYGFNIFENNGYGTPNVYDYSLRGL